MDLEGKLHEAKARYQEQVHEAKAKYQERRLERKRRCQQMSSDEIAVLLMSHVRQLGSNVAGVVVQGILTSHFPHCAVPLSLNAAELLHHLRKIYKLVKAGALHTVPKLDLAIHFSIGVAIKLVLTFIFLGNDDFVALLGHFGTGGFCDKLEHLHQRFTDSIVGGAFSRAIEAPAEATIEHRGLPEDWKEHEHDPTDGHRPNHNIVAVGAVTATMEWAATRATEHPIHKGIDRIERHPKG